MPALQLGLICASGQNPAVRASSLGGEAHSGAILHNAAWQNHEVPVVVAAAAAAAAVVVVVAAAVVVVVVVGS